MRFIPTKVHGIIDYLFAIVLIGLAFTLGLVAEAEEGVLSAAGGPAAYVPLILGIGLIAYSLLTDYELGLVRKLPMRAHLAIDAISGGLLAVSPWLFGFADYVFWPHVILGVVELLTVNMTHTVADDRRAVAAPTGHVGEHRV